MAGTKDAGTGHVVDFKAVSTVGLESSPHAEALAGLRANEARYYTNKFDHVFTTLPAKAAQDTIAWIHSVLEEERGIVIESPALEVATVEVEDILWVHVFHESGLAVNVLDDPKKRAVGFKLSEGMEPPEELSAFKWARQKSKLAGTIRGSFTPSATRTRTVARVRSAAGITAITLPGIFQSA